MRREANENRPSCIAATIETAWPPLSGVGSLRRKDKIRAWNTTSSLHPAEHGKSALASSTAARPSAYLNGGPVPGFVVAAGGGGVGTVGKVHFLLRYVENCH